MNEHLVSIIMSTYNEPESWVRSSIESVINQTYRNLEFIIVCDNPTNNRLIKVLKEYEKVDSRIKLLINEKNIGLSASLNIALKSVTGQYIARMDADDISKKNRIEAQVKYLYDNNLDLIGSGIECIDENEKVISKINSFPKNDCAVRRKIVHNNCIAHPSWIGKTKVFKDNNGYRDIPYAEDYDFLLRTLDKGYKLGNIDEILLKYRMRSTSISNKNGLKQFLISQELIRKYKNGTINNSYDNIINDINLTLEKISKEDEERYYLASTNFTEAAMRLSKINIKGIYPLCKAFFFNKFYRRKIWGYIRALF